MRKPENTPISTQTPNNATQFAPKSQTGAISSPARNFKAEAFGKCKYGFLIELLKNGKTLEEAEPIAELWSDASTRKLDTSRQEEPIFDASMLDDFPQGDDCNPFA